MQQKKAQLADFRGKIEKLEKHFQALAAELAQATGEPGYSEQAGRVDSIAALDALYDELEARLHARQQTDDVVIYELLNRAGRIVSSGKQGSVNLGHFQEKLAGYREKLTHDQKGSETVALKQQFRAGNHPLNALLKLLGKDLSFKEAEKMFKLVATEYGTSLALAAVTGNLVLKDPPQNGDISGDKDTPNTEVIPENGIIPGGQGLPGKGHMPGIKDIPGDLDIPREPAAFSEAAAVAAREPAPDKTLPEDFPGLLYRLIGEEKLSPAFWLAAYFEQKYGVVSIPAGLIKALEAASVIRSEEGPAAQWLSYLYRENSFNNFTASPGSEMGESLAFNLLLFSALLRPALVAPTLGAQFMLAKLHELPGELKTLALAVANSVKNEGDDTPLLLKREIKLLSRDAQSWDKQNRRLSLSSPLASQLWETMFEENGLLYKMLQPLMTEDLEKAAEMRDLADALREKDGFKNVLRRLYQEIPDVPENVEIFHIPGSWQVINRLKSALKLVERYVKLCEKLAETAGPGSHPQAEEIYRLLEPARKELEQLSGRCEAVSLQDIALIAAERALHSVEKYFKEAADVHATPEKAAFLEAEENPQLMQKPAWKPRKKTIERMGKALLELFSDDYFAAKETRRGKILPAREEIEPADPDRLRDEGDDLKGNEPAFPANLDKLRRSGLLTPQEREFIQNTLKGL